MKAMLISDILVAKKYLLAQIVLSVVVSAFIAISMQNLYVALPVVGVMVPFSLAFTILALDERGNWEQFRLSLPLSRPHIIIGRYASLGIIALIGLAVGLIATGLLVLAANVMPGIPQIADLVVGFSWQAIILTGGVALGILLAMLAILLPLVSRFGMTMAVRFVPFAAIVIIVIAFQAGGNITDAQLLSNLASWVEAPENTFIAAGLILAACLTLYALSALFSVRLYEKREF